MKSSPRLAGAVWTCTLVLSLIGVTAAASRAMFLGDLGIRSDPYRTKALDALGIADPRIGERPSEVRRFDGRYGAHPLLTLAHVVPGGIFLAFAPLQFWPRLRNRYRALHRWSGRVLAVGLLVATVPALYFGLVIPFGGPFETLAIVIVAVLLVTALARAYAAIRRGDVARHREWMLRAFALAAGIASIRVVTVVVDLVATPFGVGPAAGLVISLWTGWILTAGAAEVWIAHTRAPAPVLAALP
jgi:uncharacterized membrane protein